MVIVPSLPTHAPSASSLTTLFSPLNHHPTNPQVFRLSHSSSKMVRSRVMEKIGGWQVCMGSTYVVFGLYGSDGLAPLLSSRKKKHNPCRGLTRLASTQEGGQLLCMYNMMSMASMFPCPSDKPQTQSKSSSSSPPTFFLPNHLNRQSEELPPSWTTPPP